MSGQIHRGFGDSVVLVQYIPRSTEVGLGSAECSTRSKVANRNLVKFI